MKDSAGARFFALIVILFFIFAFPSPAYAQGIVYGDTIPAGTTVDHDVVLIGQNVRLDGTVNGNVFILGNQVEVNGSIDGSLILIGQNTAIGGKVSGAVYATSLTLELSSGAALGRDLYLITVSLTSQPDSRVGRDLFALGLDAGLNGQIGRDLHTAIGPIQLYNGLMHLLGFDELTLKLHFDIPQPAPPPAGGGSGTTQPATFLLPRLHARFIQQQEKAFDWTAWAISIARDWIVLSLFGLLAFWLTRPRLEQAGEPLAARPVRTTAIGLLVLVVAVNLFSVALLLAAFIFSIGLALNFVGLWQLSIALWIAAYSALALALIALWFFIVYGTKIIVVFLISNLTLNKVGASASWLKALALLIGMLVFVLLRAIPFIGWIIAVLVTATGFGSAWLAYRAGRQVRLEQMLTSSQLSVKATAKRQNKIK